MTEAIGDVARVREITRPSAAPGGEGGVRQALLASRDPGVRRWGRLGLSQAGFAVIVEEDTEAVRQGLAHLRAGDVLVIDARGRRGRRGLDELGTELARLPATVLAIYENDAELALALASGAADVARHPVTWKVLARRALRLAEATDADRAVANLRAEIAGIRSLAEAAENQLPGTGPADPLTNLPHRTTFVQMVNRVIGGGAGTNGSLALLALDLDRFQRINESLGYSAGNELLQQVAQRLSGYLHRPRPVGTDGGLQSVLLARVGGDEFAVMLSPSPGRAGLEREASWIQETLRSPFRVANSDLYVTAAIGVAVYPDDGCKAEWLLNSAETAIATSKDEGGGAARFYCSSTNGHSKRFIELSRYLHGALERGEMSLSYQPLIDSRTLRVKAVEALLRWSSPELGQVGPTEFVPVAEESGLMVPVGQWVLRNACQELRRWTDTGGERIRLAVNVSLCQISRSDFASDLAAIAEETGWDPAWIEIELSERGVLRADPDILRQLRELRALGVRISVDDFGTGNSAISYLKKFPLDTLKVDQWYVAGALSNEHDAAIIDATIAMAHSLHLNVVAEGVEELAQRDFLRRRGCDELQGFFFTEPLPMHALRPMLSRGWAEDDDEPEGTDWRISG